MTLTIAWTRNAGKHEELVFASDSRLRSFGSWDANPKLFQLERSDCAIAFAGDTRFSYPMVSQIQAYVKSDPKFQSRFQDISLLKGQILNMMNYMFSHKSDYEIPKVRFLLGGYSWDRKRFYIWHIFYDQKSKLFVAPVVKTWKGIKKQRHISVIGDNLLDFRGRLIELMKSRHKFVNGYFDMEPFEVLRDMIRESKFETIGGTPQLLKVYEHLNCVPFAVRWKSEKETFTTLQGRPLQPFETVKYPLIDSESLEITAGSSFG